jgi:hypothetical protein
LEPYPKSFMIDHPMNNFGGYGYAERPRPARTDWIETSSGRQFWPLTPNADDVCLGDIAHALGNKCRFGGHCLDFYSVAEHCVIVSKIVPPEYAREALMHDAGEAYLPDICAPVKPHIPGWKDVEHGVERAIAKHFGLTFPWPSCIKEIDRRMVVTERLQNMPTTRNKWETHRGVEPLPDVEIRCLPPELASYEFVKRARGLGLVD